MRAVNDYRRRIAVADPAPSVGIGHGQFMSIDHRADLLGIEPRSLQNLRAGRSRLALFLR